MKSVLIILLIFVVSSYNILGQEQNESKELKPDVYIDGEMYNYKIFELLDLEKIESVSVLNREEALEKYGAENGVILVKTRLVELEAGERSGASSEKHLIIIDGEVADSDDLIILNRKDVKSVRVLKGQESKEKYNAPNGVVIITTKKK
ncbi:MAG: hypothetical protein KI791_21470 [Cyclobacteriaceae bacterium]|nr:hypothetical protein [Cyclobacteriaceae bacterium SS2]